jgi:hypothetical protein
MKHLKILGLAAVAAMGLLSLVGTAAATTLTSPTGTVYTGTLKAQNENGHATFHNPVARIECNVGLEGSIGQHGVGVTAAGNVSSLTFTNCTNSWHKTTNVGGTLEIHSTGGYNGTVTSTGATFTSTRFGIECRYVTNQTDIGTLTGGSPATIHIKASIPFHSGSTFCGSGATPLTGSIAVTSPTSLYVDP